MNAINVVASRTSMNTGRVASLFGSCLLALLFVSNASAQAQRTFVSGVGDDANPCSRTQPCRTFTQAISQTNAGGEVVVLDSAGYGPFTITKAITVEAPPGVYAGISVLGSGNEGIHIIAGASDTVILRGLTLNSEGGSAGINFLTGGTLHVEECVVNGFLLWGVGFRGPGKLAVKDSTIRGNGDGILVLPSSGAATATIDNVRLEGNSQSGLCAGSGSKVTIRNSVASSNFDDGLCARLSPPYTSAELNVENCIVANNTFGGISAFFNFPSGVATVRVSNSTVTKNGIGLNTNPCAAGPCSQDVGVILSRGNNTVEGNGIDTRGTIGSYSAK